MKANAATALAVAAEVRSILEDASVSNEELPSFFAPASSHHFAPTGAFLANRSTARRRAPSRLHVVAVHDDHRNRRISLAVSEHSLASAAIVLRVVLRIRRAG